MKPLSMFLAALSVVAVGALIFVIVRKPAVQAEVRDTGKDIQRGARDAYNGTKDAAEDATDAIKDAAK